MYSLCGGGGAWSCTYMYSLGNLYMLSAWYTHVKEVVKFIC